MNGSKIIKQVKRKDKRFSKFLSRAMVILAIVFVVLGIVSGRGLFLPAFLLAALLRVYDQQ
ncbi:MAG: hypothetical protein V8R80_02970 [Eubacterium sp.]